MNRLACRWGTIAATVAALGAPTEGLNGQTGRLDLLIRGGSVYDGSGGPPRRVDVGIRGDQIVYLGDALADGVAAVRTIDATGLVVTPGFIDPHTHFDEEFGTPARRRLLPALAQGITTVVIGNDGAGPVDVARALGEVRVGIGVNVAYLVGHGSIRRAVLGMSDRAPAVAELEQMERMVATAMRGGAFGLSTGLYYAPGSYASTEEVIALAKVAAGLGGYYDSHVRDESSYTIGLLGAIDEIIRIGREANIPVHIAHIKALGVDVWGQSDVVVSRVLAARAAGVAVTADQYPYSASGTSVGAALLPRWAEAGGRDSLRRRLDDSASRAKIVKEMGDNLRRRGGAASLLITAGPWKGKRLPEVAQAMKVDSLAAAVAIVKAGDASVASFNMQEGDIDRFMVQPWVVTGSDGSGGHPRKYGTFARKIRRYALDRGLLTLTRAIQASTGQTAALVGLRRRGTVAVGNFADLAVFDSTTIADRSEYQRPEALATGMRYVVVNGRLAIDGGRPTGVLAGRGLRRLDR